MRPNLGQVDETVDLAQQVIVRDAPLQTEAVKQPLASPAVRPSSTESPAPIRRESAPGASIKQSFSTSGNGAGALLRRPLRLAWSLEEQTVQETILLASISRWMRRMFAFSIARAWWFARARPSRRRRRSPANWRKHRVVVGSCSRQDEWHQSCFTGCTNWVCP